MRLIIDDHDYTDFVDASHAPGIVRRLNRPSQLSLYLVAEMPGFVPPAAESRVVLEGHTGTSLFTGYLTSAPEAAYLGWGRCGPVYRYTVKAISDEFVLDRKLLPARAPLSARTAGAILTELVRELLPGLTTSDIADVTTLPSYASDPSKKWSQHAAELARMARAVYRAHEGAIRFRPVGEKEYLLDEASETFSPEGLKLFAPTQLVNDVTVFGRTEPRAYIKDYFLGDGLALSFSLSQQPFARYGRVFLDEEYKGESLDALRWRTPYGTASITVSGGKLRASGGPIRLLFQEQIELGGALVLQHGDMRFSAPSTGLLGALCADDQILAAFRAEPAGGETRISAVVNGAAVGTQITAVAGRRYVLTTRVYASQIYRREQSFHSSSHTRGGSAISASAHVVLEVHVLDPASPGSPAAVSTVLYEGTLSNVPSSCEYRLLDGADLHCELSYTRLSQAADIEVVSTIPGQAARTRLVGALTEGAECAVSSASTLFFYTPYVPVPYEAIRVSYRGSGRASARVVDSGSIFAHAHGVDDGVRAAAWRVALPAPRTAAECEQAALTLLDDFTRPAWAGEYRTWSDFLPGGATDIWPGDGLHVLARGEDIRATVREVEIEILDPAGDNSRYLIRFANDAADPLGLELAAPRSAVLQDVTATTTGVGNTFCDDLPGAEITAITSTTVTVDAGSEPSAGRRYRGAAQRLRMGSGTGSQSYWTLHRTRIHPDSAFARADILPAPVRQRRALLALRNSAAPGLSVMTEFEKQVLSDLTELKTQMRSLLGNGQPGRMQQLEERVSRHEVFVQRASGIGAALAMLLTMGQLALAYLRLR